MSDELFAWENEDGDLWVEVEMEADRDTAGQRLADERQIIVTFEGRGEITTQDCECRPTHGNDDVGEAHYGDPCYDHPDEACVVRKGVDCWHFQDWGDPSWYGVEDDVAREAERYDHEGNTLLIFRPAEPRVESPGQVEAGL